MSRKNVTLVLLAVGLVTTVAMSHSVAGGKAPVRGSAAPAPQGKAPAPDQLQRMLAVMEVLTDACFDERTAAMMAIVGLKDDVRRGNAEIAKDMEKQLKETRTLGLRNAIRLMLKDLYKAQDENEKVLKHLREMLAENDKAIQEDDKGDEEDEDDDDENDDDDDNK